MTIGRSLLALLAISFLAQGCAFSRGTLGDDIRSEAVSLIQKGTTTKAEVSISWGRRIVSCSSMGGMSFNIIDTMPKQAASFSLSLISHAYPLRVMICSSFSTGMESSKMSSHRNAPIRYGSDFGHLGTNVASMWSKLLGVLLVAIVCQPLAGCNVVRVTLNTSLTPEDVAFIVPGHTTLADIVGKLGAPDSLANSETGVVATYRFLDLKYSRVNFGWVAKPWTPIDPDLIFSRTGFGVDAFEVHCDRQWVVLHQGFQRHLIRPPFYPYPFQQSRVAPLNELPLPSGPAIMASHGFGHIRPSVPSVR